MLLTLASRTIRHTTAARIDLSTADFSVSISKNPLTPHDFTIASSTTSSQRPNYTTYRSSAAPALALPPVEFTSPPALLPNTSPRSFASAPAAKPGTKWNASNSFFRKHVETLSCKRFPKLCNCFHRFPHSPVQWCTSANQTVSLVAATVLLMNPVKHPA